MICIHKKGISLQLISLIFISILISIFLVILLKLINILISEETILNREELTAFECGFDTHSLARIPFSLRYFFLTLIFLLFDLEVVLLSFSPLVLLSFSHYFSILIICFFLFILLFSLYYELNDGTLEWVS